MPAKSQQQRKLIFAKRGQYNSESDTPKKWKWIWHEGWENKGKLPKKVKKKKMKNENIVTFSDYILNEGLITLNDRVNVPEKEILKKIDDVENWFMHHPDEDYCYIDLFGHNDWKISKERTEKDVRAAARMATSENAGFSWGTSLKEGKKQHIGSHSNHSYPANKGISKEVVKRYKEKPAFDKEGKIVIEDGKVKKIPRKMKIGLKDEKKFVNKKRRGFLKQDNKKQLEEE